MSIPKISVILAIVFITAMGRSGTNCGKVSRRKSGIPRATFPLGLRTGKRQPVDGVAFGFDIIQGGINPIGEGRRAMAENLKTTSTKPPAVFIQDDIDVTNHVGYYTCYELRNEERTWKNRHRMATEKLWFSLNFHKSLYDNAPEWRNWQTLGT